ncbi:MAG: lamin tail domain-containing protein, partial [Cyclobacteriaceae bacterium]|nr:lamin tail domain-containing protein [Cyclobacteriaceae bacterium]
MKSMKAFLLLLLTAAMTPVFAQHVVINEVYGAGGNAGAAFKNDFVELFNPGPAPVSLAGWSVQYASATSTGAWQVAALSGTIQPGRFYLLQLGAGSGNGQDLPTADAIGAIAMAATAGKVALVNTSTALNGACPSGIQIIDRIGYGVSANCFEGA